MDPDHGALDLPGRIAIVNRGDAALRLIRAVREYDLEHGTRLTTIALHTDQEAEATFAREADEAVSLGPAHVSTPEGGRQLAYVDETVLADALRRSRADAAWVGWGFVSERPEFADLCDRLGIRLIGPSGDVMRQLGDKVGAKRLAESVEVPVVAWSGGPVGDPETAVGLAEGIGYPLMVKAAAGGGGRGIRRVERPADLAEAFASATREAASAFGDGSVFLERCVAGARHVEVQVAADAHGTVLALGIRDCSVQRRRQKILEESGLPGVPEEIQRSIRSAAERLLGATAYTGLGTVEFLLDGDSLEFYFMEVNTRLQVEHTVTEEATGLDLVKLQLELAAGRRLLDFDVPEARGWAIEARVTAEAPLDGFRPAPGDILSWRPALGPGIRVDTGISVGDPTPSEYDPLLVKIIARGATRDEAVARLRRAVAETRLVLRNGATTLGFLRALLDHPRVLAGGADTEFVDLLVAEGGLPDYARPEPALLLVAVSLAEQEWWRREQRLFSTAARGRAELAAEHRVAVEVTFRGRPSTFGVSRLDADDWLVETPGGPVRVLVRGDRDGEREAVVGADTVVAHLVDLGEAMQATVRGTTYRVEHGDRGVVSSPLPATVVSVRVARGDRVEAGDVVAVLESMKLETPLLAPQGGVIRDVFVGVNAQVAAGERVVRLEAASGEEERGEAGLDLEGLVAGSSGCPLPWAVLTRLRGYDGCADGGLPEDPKERIVREREAVRLVAAVASVTGGRLYPEGPDGHGVRGGDALARALAAPARSEELTPPEWHEDLLGLLRLLGVESRDPEAFREGLHRVCRAGRALRSLEPVVVEMLRRWLAEEPEKLRASLDLAEIEQLAVACEATLPLPADLAWAVVRRVWLRPQERRSPGVDLADLDQRTAERLELWRFREFEVAHLGTRGGVHLFDLTARGNPADHRLVAASVLAADPADPAETVRAAERVLLESFALIREEQAPVALPDRSQLNRVVLYVDGVWNVPGDEVRAASRRLAPAARNLGIERVVIRSRMPTPDGVADRVLHVSGPAEAGLMLGTTGPSSSPMRPMTPRQQRLSRLRRRGLHDPYEIVDLLIARNAAVSDFPPGTFVELDLDEDGDLRPVEREPGGNSAGIVVGLCSNRTAKHPEGMERVILLGDPGHGLGALAEPECRRIVAALDLAEERGIPVEWFTISAGAMISMSSGTENLDWTARVLRRLVEVTQAGLEVNVVLAGVNVGAQSYFNAEATMLMHTRGILVMTPGSSMVLTGKEALDFAGGVSAEDNVGIGGHARIMGPNGQAQYWANSLEEACSVLFRHYELTYVAPGESRPRRLPTDDPVDRDVSSYPHPALPDVDFRTVGEIFSDEHNPGRNKPFDIRTLLGAVIDADHPPLERWRAMDGAQGTVVWDAHLGGIPVCLLGIESRPLPRSGVPAADGPHAWSAATLFPQSSKKVARALNAASGNRPVVVLANLAGFDGSPESLRLLQLEYGAEIGRAVTNFDGLIVFCVVSRYHGGAFVVFSKALNDRLEVLALEGARASVIGGSAAAAVVFGREVERRVGEDARVRCAGEDREAVRAAVRSEVRRAVAEEFDAIHTVERARSVGSIDRILAVRDLRPSLIDSLERGLAMDTETEERDR